VALSKNHSIIPVKGKRWSLERTQGFRSHKEVGVEGKMPVLRRLKATRSVKDSKTFCIVLANSQNHSVDITRGDPGVWLEIIYRARADCSLSPQIRNIDWLENRLTLETQGLSVWELHIIPELDLDSLHSQTHAT
jgi:hypothetical protein